MRNCFWRSLALLLALLQAYSLTAMQNDAKVKQKVNEIAIGGKITVVKVDGTEYHGNLQAIDSDTFSIREVDLRQVVTIPYGEVDKVKKNYGGKGFGGRRVDPKRSLIIGLIVVGGLIALVFAAVASDKS
jgi:hypothetical protein